MRIRTPVDAGGESPRHARQPHAVPYPPGARCPRPGHAGLAPTSALPPPKLPTVARVQPLPDDRRRPREHLFLAWLDEARALDWTQPEQACLRSFAALQRAFHAAARL